MDNMDIDRADKKGSKKVLYEPFESESEEEEESHFDDEDYEYVEGGTDNAVDSEPEVDLCKETFDWSSNCESIGSDEEETTCLVGEG